MKKLSVLLILLLPLFSLYAEIQNPDQPLKGEWDLKAQKVWEVSQYGDEPMAMPSLRAVWDDGTICLFDFGTRIHYLLDNSGKLLTTFGKSGEGPGEVRWARAYFTVNDKLIIYDRPKLHYFLKSGKYQKSVPVGGNFGTPIAFIDENRFLSYPESENGALALVNLDTGTKQDYKNIFSYSDAIKLAAGKRRISIVVPWGHPSFKLGFDPKNQRFYYGVNNKYNISIAGLDGKVVDTFSVERKKRKITSQMRKVYAERNPGEARMMSPEMRRRMPRKLNYFSNIQVLNGLVLVFETIHGEHSEEQAIDIFSLEGKYLYRTIFRPGGGEVLHSSSLYFAPIIRNGYLYTVVEDSDGESRLVKYKVSLPVS